MGRTVIETVPVDDTVSLRVYRLPTASVTHYALYRSKSRTGFSGEASDDDSGFEEVTPRTAQPLATAVFASVTSTLPSGEDVNFYYRVRATDDATTETELGGWSNVAAYYRHSDRHLAVPTWPVEMLPQVGVLSGLVTELQDSDDADGLTWLRLRQAQAVVVDEIQDQLADVVGESGILRLFRDPPAALRKWFEYGTLLVALPAIGLPDPETRDREGAALEAARRWRDALMNDVTVRLPGSTTVASTGGRLVR